MLNDWVPFTEKLNNWTFHDDDWLDSDKRVDVFFENCKDFFARITLNQCKIISNKSGKEMLLGDYILDTIPRDDLWNILCLGKDPESIEEMSEISSICAHILDEKPNLTPVLFSGDPDQIKPWLKSFMHDTGITSMVIAYYRGVPFEDLMA